MSTGISVGHGETSPEVIKAITESLVSVMVTAESVSREENDQVVLAAIKALNQIFSINNVTIADCCVRMDDSQ